MDIESWLNARLHTAQTDLWRCGVPSDLLKARLVHVGLCPTNVPCRACTAGEDIWVAKFWTWPNYLVGDTSRVERLLRHELAHVMCYWCPGIEAHFEIPPAGDLTRRYAEYAIRGFREYGRVHTQEAFAEAVADMDTGVMSELEQVI
jgi:hypothetical protein